MTATIKINDRVAARLPAMAGDQPVDAFVESFVNSMLEEIIDVPFEGRLPGGPSTARPEDRDH